MRFRTPILALALLALSACGTNDANVALQKMHARWMENITKNMQTLEHPTRAETTVNALLKILPVEGKYPTTANLALGLKQKYDITNSSNIAAETNVTLNAVADAPKSFLGIPDEKGRLADANAHLAADIALTLRAIQKHLFVNVQQFTVQSPAQLLKFSVTKEIAATWYGATFAEIDAFLAKNSGLATPQPIGEMLLRYFHGGTDKEAMLTSFENLHMWNGVKLLPSQDGMVMIGVTSDKQKIRTSIEAFMKYMQQVHQPSGNSLATAAFKTQLDKTVNDLGSANGMIAADPETYDFRGFVGDIFDSSGKKIMHLNIAFVSPSDFSITAASDDQTYRCSKNSSDYSCTLNGTVFMSGKISPDHFTITVLDRNSASAVALKADLRLASATREKFVIKNGTLDLPMQQIHFSIKDLSIAFTNSFKDLLASAAIDASYKGKLAGSLSFTSNRREVPAVSIQTPSAYAPFEKLKTDFMNALQMQSEQK
jgi:hypothetical protein